jgi:hypothetical protein
LKLKRRVMADKARDIGARKLAVCSKIPIGRSLMLATKEPSVFLRLLLLMVAISDKVRGDVEFPPG